MDYLDIDAFLKEHKGEERVFQKAFETAAKEGIHRIHFGKGMYYLKDFETFPTVSIAHDDGCGSIEEKDCHIVMKGMKNMILEGECGEDGSPATILAGYNPKTIQTLLPSILWAEDCEGLTVQNLAFTREPECASAGIVESIKEDQIYVRVLPGNPCYDGMAAYCMNRFDPEKNRLLGESLTFGFGFDKRLRLVEKDLLVLQDAHLSCQVNVGEGLSWHQAGKTDFQVFFGRCDGLTLRNLRVYNANSFAILTENCRDILAERVVIKPKGSQFFTGPRDGWKIYRCTGSITVKDCRIQGVRMDGQNVHSNFLIAGNKLSSRELLCVCKYAPLPMRSGYGLEFYHGSEMEVGTIEDWEIVGGYEEENQQSKKAGAALSVPDSSHHMTVYRIRLKEEIPDFVKEGTLMAARCWEPERYLCSGTTFANIAGAGHLLRCGEAKISGCTYQDMMNAGVLIGAELSTHCEGGHGVNVEIVGNLFFRCGTKPRYGEFGKGCIAVKSQGFHGPVNQNLRIHGNLFCDSQRALEIRDARNVEIRDNLYERIEEPVLIEKETTEAIHNYDSSKEGEKR